VWLHSVTSENILRAHLCKLFPDVLRMCRQVCSVDLIGNLQASREFLPRQW